MDLKFLAVVAIGVLLIGLVYHGYRVLRPQAQLALLEKHRASLPDSSERLPGGVLLGQCTTEYVRFRGIVPRPNIEQLIHVPLEAQVECRQYMLVTKHSGAMRVFPVRAADDPDARSDAQDRYKVQWSVPGHGANPQNAAQRALEWLRSRQGV